MLKNTLAKQDIQGSINSILSSIPKQLDTEEDERNLHIKHSQLRVQQSTNEAFDLTNSSNSAVIQ